MFIRNIIQFSIFFSISGLLFFYSFQDINLVELGATIKKINIFWVLMSLFSHLISHFIRAYRWRFLINLMGEKASLINTILAEMSGFCINLIPPRLGDFARCSVIKRLEGIPIKKTLGAALIERVMEITVYIFMVILVLILEGESKEFNFSFFLKNLVNKSNNLASQGSSYKISSFLILLVAIISVFSYLYIFSDRSRLKKLVDNFLIFLKDVFSTTKSMKTKEIIFFVGANFSCLFFYFLVEYFCLFAFEETSHLDFWAGLYIFITVSLILVLPVPGGVGTYHLAVSSILMMMGVSSQESMAYATLTHAIFLFNSLIVGGLCLCIATFISSRKTINKL